LEVIILNGLAPGGDGITSAIHFQMSAFHLMDSRLQDSSRASTSDAIILYNVVNTKPLLNVTMSGVLVTRKRILGAFIEASGLREVHHSFSTSANGDSQSLDHARGHTVWCIAY
jgi:hypothetical protein